MAARGTMIERHKTWVVVVDGARARLFKFTDRDAALRPVDFWISADAERHAGEAQAHRNGAGDPHAGHARHAKDPKADPHFRRKEDFLDAVATRINRACADGAFDRLIVVAPATALGALRQDLSQAVQERITIELAQDLTRIPDHALAEHLAHDLPIALHAPRR
jgi:protein required for attachment to host cells